MESPRCYRELTCEAVLTESFVTGKEVSNADYLNTLSAEERERLAALVADNFATQVLTDGFYHADPHSGNVLIKDAAPGASAAGDAEGKQPLPEHSIEWIDFGMMGTLTPKQRQLLIDIVTNVVMKDAYALKNTVLQIAKPMGEIDHGAMLQMCEEMCGEYTGTDFGDFDLGDLLASILSCLNEENFKVDPFLTNLARGITAAEGTVKTLSPKVNILNYFTSKVNLGLNFNFDAENLKKMNPEIAMKLLQLANSITDSSIKSAETLDMLDKGQLKLRTEFSFEEKALNALTRLWGYAIRALIIVALIIGCSLLCTTSALTGEGVAAMTIFFRGVGFIGLIVSLFFAQRLYKEMKKGK